MKLSKASWLYIALGILIIAVATLVAFRFRQLGEQRRLYEEIASVELKLNKLQLKQLSSRHEELTRRLNEAIEQPETPGDTIPRQTGSIIASDILFNTAAAYDVEVTEVSSSGLGSDKLEGVTCSILALGVKVKGELPNLMGFITKLNNSLRNGVVKEVRIDVPGVVTEKPQAAIQLVIYTYP